MSAQFSDFLWYVFSGLINNQVTNEILDKFISKMSYLAVVFFKVGGIQSYLWPLKTLQDDHLASTAALEVLEEIDDDLDEQGIVFVKLDDEVES